MGLMPVGPAQDITVTKNGDSRDFGWHQPRITQEKSTKKEIHGAEMSIYNPRSIIASEPTTNSPAPTLAVSAESRQTSQTEAGRTDVATRDSVIAAGRQLTTRTKGAVLKGL